MMSDALFDVDAARPTRPGAVAAAFTKAVRAGLEAGTLVDEDRPLIAGVAVLADALDAAQRVGGLKGGYLAAQAFPPFQRGCHALRLPVELTAVTQPAPAQGAGDSQDTMPAWARDAFGSPE